MIPGIIIPSASPSALAALQESSSDGGGDHIWRLELFIRSFYGGSEEELAEGQP
jgi:hypothetical protein